MNKSKICDTEREKLQKLSDHIMLPHSYKNIGVAILAFSFFTIIGLKFFMEELGMYRTILKQGMLVGLLIIVISKEEIEDEMIVNLRSKSFSLAFICGVIYTLIQPYINWGVAAVIAPEKAVFEEFGAFIILWFMLCIHLLFFYVFKKSR